MSDPLSHFDEQGRARMVSIIQKKETPRSAVASSTIRMAQETLRRIQEGKVGKGDVLGIARYAAIAASKQAAVWIPLCHPVRLTGIDVEFRVDEAASKVTALVRVEAIDRTGPEMEAITAASAATLTIYDMCKAMDRGMVIEQTMLVEKNGGKSGHWTRPDSESSHL